MRSCIIQNICVCGVLALGALIAGAVLAAPGFTINSAIAATVMKLFTEKPALIQVVSISKSNSIAKLLLGPNQVVFIERRSLDTGGL